MDNLWNLVDLADLPRALEEIRRHRHRGDVSRPSGEFRLVAVRVSVGSLVEVAHAVGVADLSWLVELETRPASFEEDRWWVGPLTSVELARFDVVLPSQRLVLASCSGPVEWNRLVWDLYRRGVEDVEEVATAVFAELPASPRRQPGVG
jgi:hypothetical protein